MGGITWFFNSQIMTKILDIIPSKNDEEKKNEIIEYWMMIKSACRNVISWNCWTTQYMFDLHLKTNTRNKNPNTDTLTKLLLGWHKLDHITCYF